MADVAADLRAALERALGPLDVESLKPRIDDSSILSAIGAETDNRLNTASDDADRSRLLGVRSVALRGLGEFTGAEADAKSSLKHAEAISTDLLLAPARARLAQALYAREDYAEADRLFALAEAGELPRRFLGRVRACAALSCIAQRRLTEALLHLERAAEFTSDETTTGYIAPALDHVWRLAVEGFGPPPRSWEDRAGHPAPRRFQDPRSGKWGFMSHDRQVTIPATFTDAGEFRGGIAAVRERAWGAIDVQGNLLVPFLYDGVQTGLPDGRKVAGFVDGVAVIERRGARGLVDKSGKLVLPPHHREIIVHPAGYVVCGGAATWGARDRNGEELVQQRFGRDDVLQRLDAVVHIDDGPL